MDGYNNCECSRVGLNDIYPRENPSGISIGGGGPKIPM
jgi:hypothetical protein